MSPPGKWSSSEFLSRLLCRHGAACGIAEIVHGLDLETNPIPNETMVSRWSYLDQTSWFVRLRIGSETWCKLLRRPDCFGKILCFLGFCLTWDGIGQWARRWNDEVSMLQSIGITRPERSRLGAETCEWSGSIYIFVTRMADFVILRQSYRESQTSDRWAFPGFMVDMMSRANSEEISCAAVAAVHALSRKQLGKMSEKVRRTIFSVIF